MATFPISTPVFVSVVSVWMPTLRVMELSRQLCGKMKRSGKRAPLSTSPTATWGLEIHFYAQDVHQLEYFKGCYTAEELCVDAAKKCCECDPKYIFSAYPTNYLEANQRQSVQIFTEHFNLFLHMYWPLLTWSLNHKQIKIGLNIDLSFISCFSHLSIVP